VASRGSALTYTHHRRWGWPAPAFGTIIESTGAGRRPQAVRLHRRLGREASDGSARGGGHPPRVGELATPGCPFSVVTDGIQAAIDKAKALAGDKVVGVNGGTIASQRLNESLLDEIWVDLIPVLLGGGTPFLDQLKAAPVELEGPVSVVQGSDVTHLRYRVRYR
jgi:hypothetical protein